MLPSCIRFRCAATGCAITVIALFGRRLSAQTTDETVHLSEFNVAATEDHGYFANNATSATKTATAIRDLPQGLNVLTSDFLGDLRYDNLRDALQFTTGISSGVSNRVNQEENFALRGVSLTGSFLDGLSSPSTYPQENAFIDRVEIIRGPAAVLYGTGNFGGAVNRISKKPLFKEANSIEFDAGDYATYNVIFDSTGPVPGTQTLAYRFIGTWQDRQDFIADTNNRRRFIAPSITWQPSSKTTITFNYRYTDASSQQYTQGDIRTGATIGSIVHVTTAQNLNGPWDARTTRQPEGALLVEHRFNNVFSLLQSVGWWQKEEHVLFGVVGTSPTAGTTILPRTFQIRDTTSESWTSRTDLLATYNAFGGKHHTLVSGEADWTKNHLIIDNYLSDTVNFADPTPMTYNPFAPNRFVARSGSTRTGSNTPNSSGAVQQQSLFLNDRLGFTAGVRYDQYHSDVRNRLATTPAAARQTGEGDHLSKRYGATFRVVESVNLYALYSDSFAPNTGANPDGTTFKPSVAKNKEIGFKSDFDNSRYSLTFDVYQLDITNLLKADLTRPNFSVQTGLQTTKGWEAEFTAQITSAWQAFGSYSYGITRDDQGLRVEFYPKNQAKVFNRYDFKGGLLKGLSIGGGVVADADIADTRGATRKLPSHVVADAFAAYRYKKVTYRVNISNLTNEYYYLFSGGALYTRGDPRKWTASAQYKF